MRNEMSELKTKPTDNSVAAFLDAIEDPQRRADCRALAEMMQRITGAEPQMWGPAIVGFGSYRYTYDSGRSGDWFLTGFSPRKQNIALYGLGIARQPELMQKLGKFKTAKSCLYVKRLADIDPEVLEELIRQSIAELGRLFGDQ